MLAEEVEALGVKTSVAGKGVKGFIHKLPGESVFGGVGVAANFLSSLALCSRAKLLAPEQKIGAAFLPNSRFFRSFVYISLKYVPALIFGNLHISVFLYSVVQCQNRRRTWLLRLLD